MPGRAERLNRLGTETAFEVLARVKELEAAGNSVINFAIGEPDFATPEPIKEAGIEAIRNDETHYSPSAGIAPLREAVAEWVEESRGLRVEPANVVVTPGGKPVLFYSLLACVNPGERVLYPNPGFPIYESVIRFVGGEPVPFRLREEEGFAPDPEEIADRARGGVKLIIVNSPHNPTGGVWPREVLAAILRVARQHDGWILSDEIYSQIVYDGQFLSFASLEDVKDRLILLDGFSKTFAMTGWRLGFGVMPADLAAAVARLITNNESCTATFTQYAGVSALRGSWEPVRAMVEEFRARRDLIVGLLNRVPGVSCRVPAGAFYAFPNVTELCRRKGLAGAHALQTALLEEAGVATLARSAFGTPFPGEPEYLRFSFATSRENIEAGIERIRRWAET